jgi:prepilin-type N-terminal cleavage/methylation domain-containing protein
MTPRRRAGFTLIELLTVIAIIGIMSAALFPAIKGVRKKAQQSSATTAFSQWAGGINRYKQVYGFYPDIGAAYETTKDSVHPLEDQTTNLKFVKALSGRLPTGAAMSVNDRRRLNRNGEEFCSFGKEDFENPEDISATSRLVDRFGNWNIYFGFELNIFTDFLIDNVFNLS